MKSMINIDKSVESTDITFSTDDYEEVLKITVDGSFYVKGNKVTEDIQVYNAFVEFLKGAGYYV